MNKNIPLISLFLIISISMTTGSTGHIFEQYGNNKLIHPRAEYIGARDQKYVPIGDR